MTLFNTHERYGTATIVLHWLMFLLIASTFASIELRVFFEKGTETRDLFKMIHFSLGLLVLVLVVIRLMIILPQQPPEITPKPMGSLQKTAKVMEVTLYLFMLVMPILGWLILSGADKPVPFFGFDLPTLIDPNKDFARTLKDVHETLGVIGYWLVGLHAVAALFHHYFLKDNTLKRMLP